MNDYFFIIKKVVTPNFETKGNLTIPVKKKSYMVLGLTNLKKREERGE